MIGDVIIELDTVPSTNTYLASLVKSGVFEEGTVILTETQTKGKGQSGKHWISQAGKNLTFSILLYPEFLPPQSSFYLNMVVSLSVRAACIEVLNKPVMIKWPNDIYFQNKKLGGILIENTIQGEKINTSVIGIGVNVNETSFEPILPNPISMKIITKDDQDIRHILKLICASMEENYNLIRKRAYKQLKRSYEAALYLYNQESDYIYQEQKIKAVIKGVTEDGRLKLQSTDVIIQAYFNEIKYL